MYRHVCIIAYFLNVHESRLLTYIYVYLCIHRWAFYEVCVFFPCESANVDTCICVSHIFYMTP